VPELSLRPIPTLSSCLARNWIPASKRNGTLYIGVTSNLIKRIWEHKNDLVPGFTQRYRVHYLVYVEQAADMLSAIAREKPLKKWNRHWKLNLIEQTNPGWADLYTSLTHPEAASP